jgi:hypothetical protein
MVKETLQIADLKICAAQMRAMSTKLTKHFRLIAPAFTISIQTLLKLLPDDPLRV